MQILYKIAREMSYFQQEDATSSSKLIFHIDFKMNDLNKPVEQIVNVGFRLYALHSGDELPGYYRR